MDSADVTREANNEEAHGSTRVIGSDMGIHQMHKNDLTFRTKLRNRIEERFEKSRDPKTN